MLFWIFVFVVGAVLYGAAMVLWYGFLAVLFVGGAIAASVFVFAYAVGDVLLQNQEGARAFATLVVVLLGFMTYSFFSVDEPERMKRWPKLHRFLTSPSSGADPRGKNPFDR